MSNQIKDDYTDYSLDDFCVPAHYYDDLKCVLLPKGLILDRYKLLLVTHWLVGQSLEYID